MMVVTRVGSRAVKMAMKAVVERAGLTTVV